MRRTSVLLISIAGFFAIEGAVFHSGWYGSILSPDSSTGVFERFLFIEQDRKLDGPNQVIGIGNSRDTDPAQISLGQIRLHTQTGPLIEPEGRLLVCVG